MKRISFQLRNNAVCVLALTFVCICTASGQDQPPAASPEPSHGTVLLHRGQDDAEAKSSAAPKEDPTATVPDEERGALVFQSYDLDVHLIPAEAQIAVRARFSVTNVSAKPLTKIAIQISGSLNWRVSLFRTADKFCPPPLCSICSTLTWTTPDRRKRLS